MTTNNAPPSLIKGAVAGASGVWVMDRVGTFLLRREDRDTRAQEQSSRVFGLDVAHAIVRRAAKLAGSDYGQQQPNAAGLAVHYALGIAPAAVYAKLRRSVPWLRTGRGFVYGLALWAVNDEVMTRVLRVAAPAKDYPWQAHARGVAGHVTLGVATDAVLNRLE